MQVVVDTGSRFAYCNTHRSPFNQPDAKICRVAPIELDECSRLLYLPVGDVIELTEEKRYFGGEEIKPHRRRLVSDWGPVDGD